MANNGEEGGVSGGGPLPGPAEEVANLETEKVDCQIGINHFDSVPNEIVLKFFSNLEQIELIEVAKVCQRFRDVAKHRQFWKNLRLTNACLKPDDIDILVQFPIRELELTSSRIYPIEEGNCNFRMHPEKLRLFNVDPRSCKFILKKCKAKHLTLEGTEVRPRLLNFITNNKRLQSLSMRSVFYYGCCGYFNHRIFKYCVNLKELDLGHGHLTCAQFLWLCERLPKSVERLIWHHLDLSDYKPSSPAPFIETIVERLANLRVIGVSFMHLRKLDNLDWLAKLDHLDTLLLCHCDWEEAKLKLFDILQRLPKLKIVQFRIKDELSAKNKEDLIEFKRHLRDSHRINIEVKLLRDLKCEL